MKTSLDLLNAIQIPKPCPANWAEMIGDDHARYCEICEKHVYNLSSLSADEATTLFREKEGKLCVRLYRRLDGTVMTSDCHKETPRGIAKHLATAAALATSLFVAGCSASPEPETAQSQNDTTEQNDHCNVRMGEPLLPGVWLAGSPVTEDPAPPAKEVIDIPPREVPAK